MKILMAFLLANFLALCPPTNAVADGPSSSVKIGVLSCKKSTHPVRTAYRI